MEIFTDGNAICGELIGALQQAVTAEKGLGKLPCEVSRQTSLVKEIAAMELGEYIVRFINSLNLQNVFIFLGREVRSFADALFVIFELRELIGAQITYRKNNEPLLYSKHLVNCCNEFVGAEKITGFSQVDLQKEGFQFLVPANP